MPMPVDLAAAMTRFADPKLLRSFTAEARRRKDGYTLAGMADATEAIYFELLGYRVPNFLRTPEKIALRSAS